MGHALSALLSCAAAAAAGKTYVGIQIIKLLIANTTNSNRDSSTNNRGGRDARWLPQQPAAAAAAAAAGGKPDVGPILTVCYTNHAIDSLLEGLLDAGVATEHGQMVRVGGGSKSERLELLNLSHVSETLMSETHSGGEGPGVVQSGRLTHTSCLTMKGSAVCT
jgi:hypothetical protein